MALRAPLKVEPNVVPLEPVGQGGQMPPPAAPRRAKTTPGREGKSQVAFFVDQATKRQLETVCFQERRRLQAVMEEALDLLFQARGLTRTGG